MRLFLLMVLAVSLSSPAFAANPGDPTSYISPSSAPAVANPAGSQMLTPLQSMPGDAPSVPAATAPTAGGVATRATPAKPVTPPKPPEPVTQMGLMTGGACESDKDCISGCMKDSKTISCVNKTEGSDMCVKDRFFVPSDDTCGCLPDVHRCGFIGRDVRHH